MDAGISRVLKPRRSQTAATALRNRSACILQETPVELRRFLTCARRDKACLDLPGAGRFGHQPQSRTARKIFRRFIRIYNAMPSSHSLRCRLLPFLTKSVLVAAILPGLKLFPWLRREKARES